MSFAPRTSKPTKPPNQSSSTPQQSSSMRSSTSSSLSTHLAMVELKQRILTSLSKLSDRDTYQIAVEDLEKIIQTLSPEGIPMLLNCLYEASSDPKPAVKKESLRLLAVVCASHGDSTSAHLTKIIAHIVKRLKDSDSSVKEACRETIGALSAQYLKGENGNGDNGGLGSVVALFVKPLFETMGEQNKGVQAGAAMCLAKMVECASDPPVVSFQKLCSRICKMLNSPNFQAKAALLPVVSSLSQVRAISPQSLDNLLQCIHECLGSSDWATRKAAAEALIALGLHSSNLVADGAVSTLTMLEACRFDKIKPVRDSMTEALQLWKKIAGKGEDGAPEDKKSSNSENHQPTEAAEKDEKNLKGERKDPLVKDSSNSSSPNSKGGSIPDKAVVILKKKAPVLTDKDLNPEFFHKLETRCGDLPVEVVVPRRYPNSSNSNNEEESEQNNTDAKGRLNRIGNVHSDDFHGSFNSKYRNIERVNDLNQRESSGNHVGFSKTEGQSEASFINNKGNWLAIQRQLLQLERQQSHLMNMLQDFMGGSHDSMITLENRVRGLERIVEDMARDLSISSGRRGGNFAMGFDGSNRPLGKYNGFSEYSSAKFGRSGDGRMPFVERFAQTDGIASGMRGRGPHWRPDASEAWDFPTYGSSRNGQIGSRRTLAGASSDGRSPKAEHEGDQGPSRRGWDKGAGPIRLGEGPSARSVWRASKDEATLEAIRVAGEDNGHGSRTARVAIPELTAEAMGDDNVEQERDPVWTSWTNAMDALQAGDMDSAYAEMLSTGDDILLVKLMDRSGPVIDQLSNEIASEVLHAVTQFLSEQNLFDICLSWIQQLTEIVLEHGPDILGIPMEVKKELLLNLHEASLTMDPPEDWECAMPDQIGMQLASAWGIDLQQHEK
ncbi:microtubule-associated protein TORTIFOLIA1 [Cannabis sativa]|uniref:TOG domain-containing protein n=1 Tax=Cannabis sativa TaxID=3483 RepID=A0A803Q7M5_CANSA|nr:microtubule-associated protein TORTIFOLIA1 [Cannabis sativa]